MKYPQIFPRASFMNGLVGASFERHGMVYETVYVTPTRVVGLVRETVSINSRESTRGELEKSHV
jgi:hypothetical protein